MAIVLALLIGSWLATIMIGAQATSTAAQPNSIAKQPSSRTAPQATRSFRNRVPAV